MLFTLTYLAFGKDFLRACGSATSCETRCVPTLTNARSDGGNYYKLDEPAAAVGAAPARRAPAYIPPETLLAEPTVDRMVPLR